MQTATTDNLQHFALDGPIALPVAVLVALLLFILLLVKKSNSNSIRQRLLFGSRTTIKTTAAIKFGRAPVLLAPSLFEKTIFRLLLAALHQRISRRVDFQAVHMPPLTSFASCDISVWGAKTGNIHFMVSV